MTSRQLYSILDTLRDGAIYHGEYLHIRKLEYVRSNTNVPQEMMPNEELGIDLFVTKDAARDAAIDKRRLRIEELRKEIAELEALIIEGETKINPVIEHIKKES